MHNLLNLTLFELKKNLIGNRSWINNGMFLLVNMTILPFTISPSPEILGKFFISSIMTSILLGMVLITNHIFDEDSRDGTLNQFLTFGIPHHIIYLSKVIAASIEFILIITIIMPVIALFYMISFEVIWKIWLAILLSIPLLSSISVFGSMLTINLAKNSVITILLIFPLLISALIILSLASGEIINMQEFSRGFSYLKMNIGFTLLLLPLLCWLSKHLC